MQHTRPGSPTIVPISERILPEQGLFDTRWSHCHQWSGCPTWQMSRYSLGLRPRLDLAPDTFEFCLSPIPRADGSTSNGGKTTESSNIRAAPTGGWSFIKAMKPPGKSPRGKKPHGRSDSPRECFQDLGTCNLGMIGRSVSGDQQPL